MESKPNPNDEEVAKRPSPICDRGGDHPPFSKVVLEYEARVHGFIKRKVPQYVDAEDLTQETFKNAFLAYAEFDTTRELWPWLRKIATNCILEAHRAKQALKRKGKAVPLGEPEDAEGEPLAALLAIEDRNNVRIAMQALGAEDRWMLEERYEKDTSVDSLAKALGLSVPAASSRLHRARKKFAKHLEAPAKAQRPLTPQSSRDGGVS